MFVINTGATFNVTSCNYLHHSTSYVTFLIEVEHYTINYQKMYRLLQFCYLQHLFLTTFCKSVYFGKAYFSNTNNFHLLILCYKYVLLRFKNDIEIPKTILFALICFLRYILLFSSGLAGLNVLPLFSLDGKFILGVLIDAFFQKWLSYNQRVCVQQFIFCCSLVIIIGFTGMAVQKILFYM